MDDPIITGVRAARDAHGARFDYDVAAIFRDIRAMQEESGRECVRLPGRAVVAYTGRKGMRVVDGATGDLAEHAEKEVDFGRSS
jgi:hypothetical protein